MADLLVIMTERTCKAPGRDVRAEKSRPLDSLKFADGMSGAAEQGKRARPAGGTCRKTTSVGRSQEGERNVVAVSDGPCWSRNHVRVWSRPPWSVDPTGVSVYNVIAIGYTEDGLMFLNS